MTTPTLHQAAQMALDAPMPEPAAWKHDCAALCTNDVELWIDACPHCGKPRTAPPAAPASQWMPIETAPKDSLYEDGENRYGRRILVWGNGYDEPMRARWWFRIDSNRQNFISDAGFAVFPTHWMPLPAAPDHLRDVAEKAAPAAPVPDGWVMAPREPTQKMERAGNDVGLMGMSSLGSGAVYRAMIAASPAAPVVREPLRDDAFHAWVEEASADHPNLLERQEFRDAMYNAWINGYNTRVDEQAHGITGGSK